LRRERKKGTLNGILKQAGIDGDEFRRTFR